jgi:hypothetical protein
MVILSHTQAHFSLFGKEEKKRVFPIFFFFSFGGKQKDDFATIECKSLQAGSKAVE